MVLGSVVWSLNAPQMPQVTIVMMAYNSQLCFFCVIAILSFHEGGYEPPPFIILPDTGERR